MISIIQMLNFHYAICVVRTNEQVLKKAIWDPLLKTGRNSKGRIAQHQKNLHEKPRMGF
jgi:hypothetical protein